MTEPTALPGIITRTADEALAAHYREGAARKAAIIAARFPAKTEEPTVTETPARDDDYTPEGIDRDQAADEPVFHTYPDTEPREWMADEDEDAPADEPFSIAPFIQALVAEIERTDGVTARREILRGMVADGYPHLVRIAMGDLLTVVANYRSEIPQSSPSAGS